MTACGTDPQIRVENMSSARPEADLHLAVLPTADCLPLLYAQEAGLFDSLRLSVDLQLYESQADADTALLSGWADGGVADEATIARLQHKRGSYDVFCSLPGGCGLVAAPSLRLKKTADLKGRVVAVAPGRTSERVARAATSEAKLGERDVMYPHIGSFAVRWRMVCGNQVDATVLPEPYLTAACQQGCPKLYTSPAANKGRFIFTVRALNQKEMPARLNLLRQVWNRAADSLNTRGASLVCPLLVRKFGIPADKQKGLRLTHYEKIVPTSQSSTSLSRGR